MGEGARLIEWIYQFQAAVGGAIVRHKNQYFYGLLLLGALFSRLFGLFVLACLLCYSLRGSHG